MQGMETMSELNIDTFYVFGDSKIAIQMMKNIQYSKGKEARKVQKIILIFSLDFLEIQFFHVKFLNNKEANRIANIGAKLRQGEMVINNSRPIIKWKNCFH